MIPFRWRVMVRYCTKIFPLSVEFYQRKQAAAAMYQVTMDQLRFDLWPRFLKAADEAIEEVAEELKGRPQGRPCPHPPGHCPICPPPTPRDPGAVN